MATYCFRCRVCEATFQIPATTWHGSACPTCGMDGIVRDYRAEGVGVQVVQLQRERERGGRSAVRDTFLPTAKDFESPSDPDGAKGIRQWADEHAPREGNSKPLYPDIPKRSF